jgi:lipoprotein-anchoring transpeptidase ErfK/SrfK
LYEPDPKHNDGVREQRKIAKGSIFAVVGTWNTLDEFDQRQRVALLTSGQFVSVRDIEAAKLPQSVAVTLDGTNHKLPLAFVVAEESTSNHVISPSEVVKLTGASRLVDGERLWTRAHGGTLRDRDAIVVRARQEYPSFVDKHTHYADLDLTRGVLVLYEGKTPSYVTLAMRLPRKKPTGTAYVRNKQVTTPSSARVDGATAERRDLAWHLELDNGLVVQAAAGLNGYRESSQSGAVELHPDDAKRLFQWLLPELPSNWHGVVVSDPEREGSPILLH